MIPSWSNHCIDYYPLRWQGATLQAQRIELLRGSDMFRPTGMVRKNDREYYFADWVSPSYELHGMGRLWKLTIDPDRADWLVKESQEWTPEAQLAERLRSGLGLSDAERSLEALFGWVQGSDPYLADAAQRELARIARDWSQAQWQALPSERRVEAFVAMRKEDFQNPRWVRMLWSDPDPEIRFEALRWIADGVWKEYLPEVLKMLEDPALEYRLFEAALATTNTLKGDPSQGVTDAKMLVERITHPNTPARIAAYAMRLAPVENKGLGIVELKHLLDRNDPDLTREVVRSLALRKDQESQELLEKIARDASMDEPFRLDALAGLIGTSKPTARALVESLAKGPEGSLAREAQRVLRQSGLDPEVRSGGSTSRQPRSLDQWLEALGGLGGAPDPQAGRRIFFHVAGAACSQCHRHEGRGNVVGPDLSLIAKQGTPREILQSILEPNREVAPQFYTTHLELTDGSDFTGILLRSSSNEVYRNGFGQEVTFQKSEIQDRKELRSSLMPSGLLDTMSDREVRDLLAFLLQVSR
jgi:putative heme-binding domain-containing protein